MRTIDILLINRELIERLHNFGINADDCQHIKLFQEFERLKNNGEKVTYIVAALSEKYDISERKIYKIVRKFGSECRPDAV
jgi:Mor family transcriptional regulator